MGSRGMGGFATARDKLALHWGRRVLSRFVRPDPAHPRPVAVMIPLAPKDAARARISIPLTLSRIAHPVARAAVVAPESEALRALAGELGVDFIEENAPLAAHLGAGAVAGMKGWHKQQFLKLLAPEVMGHDHVVTMDSDTYPLFPTAYLTPDERLILLRGDRNRAPFHAFTEAMIGPCPGGATSYVAHTMLFRAGDLAGLRAAIETRCDAPWIEATLAALARLPAGSMSEFDLLGHWLMRDAPQRVSARYYSGIKVSPAQFAGDAPLPAWKRRFRFVSNHQH